MPYTKIYIHLIWSTKNRDKIISQDFRESLINHIKENCKLKGILLDVINCTSDHIHILIRLHPDQKLSYIIQLIKGESSFWINKNKYLKMKFEWQSECMAVSVSQSNIERIRDYILNQEEHHRRRTFSEKYTAFLEEIGFTKEKGVGG